MSHTLDIKKIDEVYEAIEPHMEKLSKWERDFITDTRDHWERYRSLSDGQLIHLEKIYLKIP